MKLHQALNDRAEELIELFEQEALDEVELITRLREETRSNIFFKLFLERLLRIAYDQQKLIASKGLLKHYLLSDIKEYDSYDYVGEQPKSQDALEIENSNMIKKGLFFKIIEQLGLTRTVHAYTAHVLMHAQEYDGENYVAQEDEKFAHSRAVVEVLFAEFDNEIGSAQLITF